MLTPSLTFAEDKYAWQWIKDPNFNAAYKNTIVDKEIESWVEELSGPSHLNSTIEIEGKHITFCK